MKILLINPPRENEIIGNNPSIIEEERGCNPPLGLLYVAAYLEKHSQHDVRVLDAQVDKMDYRLLERRVHSIRPDVVGVTAMTMTLIDVMMTIEIVKGIGKNTKVVLGGPHVHLFSEETIKLKNVDYLVLGEGEEAFKELLDFIPDVSKMRKVSGLVFQDNGKIVNTGVRASIKELDELPFPSRHLVPFEKYNSLLSKGSVATTVFTSRGCPFKCSFCDRPHLGKVFRARSPKNVVDELEECTDMGIREFLFYDDTFTVDKRRALKICDEIVRRKLDIGWDIRARVDTVDEEVLRNLKRAGCQGIHYGIEAGSERILKVLNKGITIKQAKHVFRITRKIGISILAYFMIGNPEETMDDIDRTFDVMRDLNPDYVHLTVLTPFPGTKIYFNGLERGIIGRDYWREFAENPTIDFVPPHWGERFSRDELQKLLKEGYRCFYVRPSYILKRLARIRSLNELRKHVKAGLKVVAMR